MQREALGIEMRDRINLLQLTQGAAVRWMMPCTSYSLAGSNSVKYDPSCPVIRVFLP